MNIHELSNEIFEKSYSRDSLEKLLRKEIALKIETAINLKVKIPDKAPIEIILETLNSK